MQQQYKILTIQQGWPRGVSSVGNPRQVSKGFSSGSLAEVFQLYWLDILCEVYKGLTKY